MYSIRFKFKLILCFYFLIIHSSCQKKIYDEKSDPLKQSQQYIDEGRSQEAIDTLVPIVSQSHDPKFDILLATAYLQKSKLTTNQLVNVTLEFVSDENSENHKFFQKANNDKPLRGITQVVTVLNDLIKKLQVVPYIDNEEQRIDLEKAIFYLQNVPSSYKGAALFRSLIRLVKIKHQIYLSFENILIKQQAQSEKSDFMPKENQCVLNIAVTKENIRNLIIMLDDFLKDLTIAMPHKSDEWEKKKNDLFKIKKSFDDFYKASDDEISPLTYDLVLYFLKINSFSSGCE